MVEIKLTEQAISDLEDMAEYISKDSFYYASLQVQKLIDRTIQLEKQPDSGRVVPELNVKSIRELIEGNYRIVYKIIGRNQIHILTFHHSKRRFNPSHIRRIIRKNK